ncbi:dihydrofolate reductase family protein [Halocatena halophila]|uniref:dihydrofolate reductase family protein n=1 Tax=Halocatena halophila TaxID=2814576 RepID=UPI002ED501CD
MGNIIVSEFMSLDGVVQAPGGPDEDRSGGFEHGGWSFQFEHGPEFEEFKLSEVAESDALLLGRKTYDIFAAYWPTADSNDPMASKLNKIPKYVVSRSLEDVEWNNSTLIEESVPDEIPELKREVDGDILVYGSAQLVHTLTEHDLIDEYRLMTFPIVLGSGKRLFGETNDTTTLQLVDTKTIGEEIVILTYQPTERDT